MKSKHKPFRLTHTHFRKLVRKGTSDNLGYIKQFQFSFNIEEIVLTFCTDYMLVVAGSLIVLKQPTSPYPLLIFNLIHPLKVTNCS